MISLCMSEIELLAWKGAETLSDNHLFELLYDEDYRVRSVVARVIQLRGNKETLPKIISLADSSEAYLREVSAFILGQFGTPDNPYREQYTDTLIKLSNDIDAEVRASVCSAIGHLYCRDMPEVLENILSRCSMDKSNEVRECVAIALGSVTNIKKAEKILNKLQQDDDLKVADCADVGLEMLLEVTASRQ